MNLEIVLQVSKEHFIVKQNCHLEGKWTTRQKLKDPLFEPHPWEDPASELVIETPPVTRTSSCKEAKVIFVLVVFSALSAAANLNLKPFVLPSGQLCLLRTNPTN